MFLRVVAEFLNGVCAFKMIVSYWKIIVEDTPRLPITIT